MTKLGRIADFPVRRVLSSYGQPVSSSTRPVTVLEKSDVLPALFGVWDDLDTLLSTISEAELLTTQTELPGWHVRDVVAHIIGIELASNHLGLGLLHFAARVAPQRQTKA